MRRDLDGDAMTGPPGAVHGHAPGGPAPWDIGAPQPALRAVALAGGLHGRVLDVGCGSGEHALLAAELGLAVVGVDSDEAALARARQEAGRRGLAARFVRGEALDLARLADLTAPDGAPATDTVIDSLLFHGLPAQDRRGYAEQLRRVLRPGGRLLLLTYGEAQAYVPHGLRHEVFPAVFATGWRISGLEATRVSTRRHPDGARGWLVSVVRLPDGPYRARGTAPTERSARYVHQLADHLAAGGGTGGGHSDHRHGHGGGPLGDVVVQRSPVGALVRSASGSAVLTAADDALLVDLVAGEEDELDRLRQAFGARVEVIGRRDGLALTWEQAPG